MIKYLDIFSPLAGSKEETREWLREKSGEFCDHKIQKKCLFKAMNAWFTELSEVDRRKLIDELYIKIHKKNVYLKLWMRDSQNLAKSIGGNL